VSVDDEPPADAFALRDPAGAILATAPPRPARAAASRAKAPLGMTFSRTKTPGLAPAQARTPGLLPTRAKAPPSYVPAKQRREPAAPSPALPFATLDKLPKKGK
jgi:hypothetical protein